jgi:PhnB protein
LKISPYLSFDGQCQAALEFYARCLGGTIVYSTTYGESPMASQVPPGWVSRIYHATLTAGGRSLGAADAPPGAYSSPQGFFVMLEIDEPAEAERIFGMLSEGGIVQMPIQATHWARRFGVLTDPFGIPWMINCGEPA